MTDVLAVNVGSSSLKLDVVSPDGTTRESRHLGAWDGSTTEIAKIIDAARPDAVGHRIVHGGAEFESTVRITSERLDAIGGLVPLAQLHQARAIEAIRATMDAGPDLPQFACFDTAFHSSMPAAATTYAVPQQWRSWGVRKYGFHGLSHSYVARRAAELCDRDIADLRTISCHLGSGASLCAIDGGRSVDTTMGFTPMEGLIMGTRPGTLDPGVVPWLVQEHGLSIESVLDQLEHHSGLQGLAGSSDLGALCTSDDPAATAAIDAYVHRLTAQIGSMAVALGAVDVMTFTGGVGENVAALRERVCERLTLLGVVLDSTRNSVATGDADVGVDSSAVRVLVIASREEAQIAAEVRSLL